MNPDTTDIRIDRQHPAWRQDISEGDIINLQLTTGVTYIGAVVVGIYTTHMVLSITKYRILGKVAKRLLHASVNIHWETLVYYRIIGENTVARR
tara:strand:- start:3579 stop:3860 length:282 start_codon:yes stop_codon:yes gene_type:complete